MTNAGYIKITNGPTPHGNGGNGQEGGVVKLIVPDDEIRCSDCGLVIPEGEHVCIWSSEHDPAAVRFVCDTCGMKYEDITEEVTGRKSAK